MSEFFWNTITENMKFVLNGVSQNEIGEKVAVEQHTFTAFRNG